MARVLGAAPLLALVLSCDHAAIDSNQRCAAVNLKILVTAETDFKANDRDGDKVQNYWVKDVSGLHGLQVGGESIRLIDRHTAKADRTPGRGAYPGGGDEPPNCGYFFGSLRRYVHEGKSVPYDDGKGRNDSRFGFVAWPEKLLRKGMPTYIVSEKGAVFSKDTGGKPVDEFPEDPQREGWAPVD